MDDIHTLAFELACDSIKFYDGGRSARHRAPDIHTVGLERVATQKLELFNAKVTRGEDQIVVAPYERRRATADLDPSCDMMAILVSTHSCDFQSRANITSTALGRQR